jgi:hypothetical protein
VAHVHGYEEIRIGQKGCNGVQPGDVPVSLRQQCAQFAIEFNVRLGWQGFRNESLVPGGLLNVAACALR